MREALGRLRKRPTAPRGRHAAGAHSPAMYYLYVVTDRAGSWATLRARPMPSQRPGKGVHLIGACKDWRVARDLYRNAEAVASDLAREIAAATPASAGFASSANAQH